MASLTKQQFDELSVKMNQKHVDQVSLKNRHGFKYSEESAWEEQCSEPKMFEKISSNFFGSFPTQINPRDKYWCV